MSTYYSETRHPETGEWQQALWMDDYFGRHRYGVLFLDGKIFRGDDTRLKTRAEEEAAALREDQGEA